MRLFQNPRTRAEVGALLVTTSWDDGHPSDLRVADLLDKHELSGTFYVPCSNSEGKPVMRSTEIVQLGRRFEIGGHTRDHISLAEMSPQRAVDQIVSNKCWLEDVLGREVCGFAYVRGRYNRTVRSMVGNAGYRYARTTRNLWSSPGIDPLTVPTTVQFFAHSRSTYIRNYMRGGPNLRRGAVLASVIADDQLTTRFLKAAEASARMGGYFHLWGHSWELDEHDLWGELDRLLGRLRGLNATFVTNAVWCAGLTMNDAAETPILSNRRAKDLTDASPIVSDLVARPRWGR